MDDPGCLAANVSCMVPTRPLNLPVVFISVCLFCPAAVDSGNRTRRRGEQPLHGEGRDKRLRIQTFQGC